MSGDSRWVQSYPKKTSKNTKKTTKKHQNTICFRFWKGTKFQYSPQHLALQDGQDPETLQAVTVTAKLWGRPTVDIYWMVTQVSSRISILLSTWQKHHQDLWIGCFIGETSPGCPGWSTRDTSLPVTAQIEQRTLSESPARPETSLFWDVGHLAGHPAK